jgi:hypothetical protein
MNPTLEDAVHNPLVFVSDLQPPLPMKQCTIANHGRAQQNGVTTIGGKPVLKLIKLNGKWATRPSWVREWLKSLEGDTPEPAAAPPRSVGARRAASEAAAAKLAAMGC